MQATGFRQPGFISFRACRNSHVPSKHKCHADSHWKFPIWYHSLWHFLLSETELGPETLLTRSQTQRISFKLLRLWLFSLITESWLLILLFFSLPSAVSFLYQSIVATHSNTDTISNTFVTFPLNSLSTSCKNDNDPYLLYQTDGVGLCVFLVCVTHCYASTST